MADRFAALASTTGDDPAEFVVGMVRIDAVFGPLAGDRAFGEDLTRALRAIHEDGARAALRQAVRRQS